MGTEVEVVTEIINKPVVNSWLASLQTTGLVIVALTVIIVVLAKTGVFIKILDFAIQTKGLSTGFNKEALHRIDTALDRLLANGEQTKTQITALEEQVNKNTAKIKEIKIESVKKSIFHKGLFLIDRMAAGICYLQEGGNSETEYFLLNQLCFEDLPTWNGLCKALNANQYWRNENERPAGWKSQIVEESAKCQLIKNL